MLSKRKQLYRHKIDTVLKRYNAVLIYQHSGLTTTKWKELREILAQISNSASTLPLSNADMGAHQQELCSRPEANAVVVFIRDKIAPVSERLQILSDSASRETGRGKRKETMYQGPILLVACNSHEDMVSAHSAVTKQAESHKYSVLLLGGSYCHTTLNHRDVCRLISLDKSIYASLLNVVKSVPKTLTLRLLTVQHNLVSLVENGLSET
jgi:hypothetical protein